VNLPKILLYCYSFTSYCSEALHSVVCLGFQDGVPPFSAISDQCLPVFISILLKSSSTSYLHLLRGLPLFRVPSVVAVAISFDFFSFEFFRLDHTILAGGILCILPYIVTCLLLPSFFLFCRVPLLLQIRIFFLKSAFQIFGTQSFVPWSSPNFLGTFAKLRKATISFVTSVRPSVRPHGTIRLPPDGFL